MVPSSIGSSTSATPPSALTPTTQGLNSLNPTDFYKLLITELQSQDPLKPTDSNQLVQEMSTIQQMSTSTTLNTTLNNFSQQQRIGEASNMIGRYVTGNVTSQDGSQTVPVQGVVIGVQFDSGGNAVLQLHTGQALPTTGVTSVQLADPNTLNPVAPSSAASTTGGTDVGSAARRILQDTQNALLNLGRTLGIA